MRTIRTEPRLLPAQYIHHGDEVALYQVGGKHTPSEVCDCPKPDGRKHWHCAKYWNFAKSLEFVESNPASIIWALVADDPKIEAVPAGFFGVPAVRFPIVPIIADRLGNPVPIKADTREPAIVRERVRIATEGQSATTGVTVDELPEFKCPEFEWHPTHPWIDEKHVGVGRVYYCSGFGHPAVAREARKAALTLIEDKQAAAVRTPPPGHEDCDLDRRCSGGPYQCLQDTTPAESVARLHALGTVDVSELPHAPGESVAAVVAHVNPKRVGVSIGRTMGESAAVDFHSHRDSEDSL